MNRNIFHKSDHLKFRVEKKFLLKYLTLIFVVFIAGYAWAVDTGTTTEIENKPSVQAWTPCGSGPGTPNPATIYCNELGYKVEIVNEKGGGQHSVCVFPDKNSCDAWKFMIGGCGKEYSYCAKYGYDQVIKTDGKHPFSPTYAVCVQGSKVLEAQSSVDVSNEVGNPLDLMGITDRLLNRQLPESEILLPKSSLFKIPVIMPAADLPASFDWRDNGGDWTTPPKDQNSCGACWAFSAVSATEGAYNLFVNDPDYDLNLAEEYPNSDCLVGNSCCGGWHYNAFELIKTNGVPDEECLPYNSAFYSTGDCNCFGTGLGCPDDCPQNDTGVCNEKDCEDDSCADVDNRLIGIADYVHLDEDTDTIKQALIDKGPLSTCFGTKGGVYWDEGNVRRCNSDNPGYVHCVTIVGFNDADGGYWTVKDNYGTTSGDGTGHWRMGYDECNIQKKVYYAVPDEDANLPPVADVNGPYSAECTGETTELALDGTGSIAPSNGVIYSWASTCPGASFDDSLSVTPILTIDTSASSVCPMNCEVTLTVSDDTWPESTSTTTVTITDTTSPVLVGVPADITVECDSVPVSANVTATDNCDPRLTLNYTELRTDGSCPSDYTLLRTWSAVDGCGNETTAMQTITVVDTVAPVISCNAPISIIPPDAPISFTATVTDNCDSDPFVEITGYDCFFFTKKGKRIDKTESCVVEVVDNQISIVDSGGVGDQIIWTVESTDDCGNSSVSECQVAVVNPGNSM